MVLSIEFQMLNSKGRVSAFFSLSTVIKKQSPEYNRLMSRLTGGLKMKILNSLLIFIPISIALSLAEASPNLIFLAACLAILPLAGIMGEATEEISKSLGPSLGGLLNATFGNAAELIITFFALKQGMLELVKASLTGSIIGNILLVLGLSILMGGLKHKKQRFNSMVAGTNASMLMLAVIGLLVPAIFMHSIGDKAASQCTQALSFGVALILMTTYILSLYFSFGTHRDIIRGMEGERQREIPKWSKGKAIFILILATIFVVLESEFLVGSVEYVVSSKGLSEAFIGIIIIPLIGNAAEHGAAVIMAIKDRMDLSLGIAVGSSTQIALFVAPLLVLISFILNKPMDLVFNSFEVTSIAVAVTIANLISLDGESNWFEGVQLLGAYLIIALAFFYIPH